MIQIQNTNTKSNHQSLYGTAPIYISELLKPKTIHPRTLRSDTGKTLHVPKTTTKNYGDRSFQAATPRLWNDLPNKLRNTTSFNEFKCLLKTYLFRKAYYELHLVLAYVLKNFHFKIFKKR